MIWESTYRLTRSWIRYQTKWELYFQQEQATRQAIPRETPLGVDKKKKKNSKVSFSVKLTKMVMNYKVSKEGWKRETKSVGYGHRGNQLFTQIR